MSFRRSDDASPVGPRWRRAQRTELLRCGVPDVVASSDRRWVYALLHGYDPETGWDVSWIGPAQLAGLLALLARDLRREAGHSLLQDLRRGGPPPGLPPRGG